ncbi:MAG: hypothetical protein LBQ54_04985 [Planctomycetaceae bacterium]|jgi:hypothetical protein|nr:hypothetical protein [Planctomycetaceae bacterium]
MTHYGIGGLIFIVILFPVSLLRSAELDAAFFQMLADFSPETWDSLQDSQEPAAEQIRIFTHLIDRMKERVPDDVLDENARKNEMQTVHSRGMIFRCRGTVTRVQKRESLYRVEMNPQENGSQRVIVFTDRVPEKWTSQETLSEPAGFTGLLVKTAEGAEIYLAKRMKWYPRDDFLGEKGYDVGLFDLIRQPPVTAFRGHREKFLFGDQDRVPFFSLLQTLREHSGSHELQRKSADFLKRSQLTAAQLMVELFNHPEKYQGTCVTMTGRVKRLTRMDVKNAGDRKYFGLDHYFLLFLFNEDTQQNPVVFCVTELPPGMPAGENSSSLEYNELVRCSGVFYKTWAYPIHLPQENDTGKTAVKPATQLAPMMVGVGVTWYPEESGTGSDANPPSLTWGLGVFCGFAVIWLCLLRIKSRSKKPEFRIGKPKE